MYYKQLALMIAVGVMGGCSASTFQLSDDSAMQQLMVTKRVVALQQENPTRLICFVENVKPGERDLYLGEDHPDHTVRVGTFRVTADGRVWEQDVVDPDAPWITVH